MIKYPFTPQLLDALPEELAELFRGLELKLLQEICSRLKLADQLNEVTVQDIRALRSHGIDLKDIEKAIREVTGISKKKLDELLDDVVARNQAYYDDVITLAQVTAPQTLVDEADIKAIREQCQREFGNITGSMGFLVDSGKTMLKPAKAYQHCLDAALLQVQSGAISYNAAIRNAVRELADSGLKTVDYESGHVDQIDVAVRRAVMTGVNQVNAKYREQSMDYLGTDLVEVTAHLGARNTEGPKGWENHAKWQGKVYRWKGYHQAGNDREPAREAAETTQAPEPVRTSPEPQRPARRRTEAKRTPRTRFEDITDSWYSDATPGSHRVEDAQEVTVGGVTYRVDGKKVQLSYSPHEKEIAELLEREVGGEMKMLPVVKFPSGVRTPDYLFNGKSYDLKTLEKNSNGGKNRIYNPAKKSKGQSKNIIIDITESGLKDEVVESQIDKVFWSKETEFIEELVIIKDGKIIGVYKRK